MRVTEDNTLHSAKADRKTTETIDRFGLLKRVAITIFASIFFPLGQIRDAAAKADVVFDKTGTVEEIIYTDDKEAKKYKIRIGSLSEVIGNNPSSSKIESPIFEKLRRTQQEISGVNDTIQNVDIFREFLIDEIKKAKEALGIKEENEKLEPRQLLEISIYITKINLIPDSRLETKYNIYDPILTKEINETPIDKLLMEKKIGVCRHFSVAMKRVTRGIIDISKSPYLQNLNFAEHIINSNNHAIIIVEEVGRENGDLVINFGFLDAIKQYGIEKNFIIWSADALSYDLSRYSELLQGHILSIFPPDDRASIMQQIVNEDERTPAITKKTELAYSYLEQLTNLYQQNKHEEAERMFLSARQVFTQWLADDRWKSKQPEYIALSKIIANIYRLEAEYKSDIKNKIDVYISGLEFDVGFYKIIPRLYDGLNDFKNAEKWYLRMLEKWDDKSSREEVAEFYKRNGYQEKATNILK